MKTQEQSLEALISASGLKEAQLGEKGEKIIQLYQGFSAMQDSYSDNPEMLSKARKGMDGTIVSLKKLIEEVAHSQKSEEERKEEKEKEKEQRKEKSLRVVKQVKEEVEPELDKCREALRLYRQKKKAGATPKPKKTRITKLKERLLAISSLIPKEMRDDEEILNKTEAILLDTLHSLTDLWGMNRIHPAEKAITEKFDQLEEKAKDHE